MDIEQARQIKSDIEKDVKKGYLNLYDDSPPRTGCIVLAFIFGGIFIYWIYCLIISYLKL